MSPDRTLFGIPAEKGRWVMVILGMLINLCLGSIYSWSVFVKPLTDYFTKTLGQSVTANDVLMPFSVFLAFFAIAMPLTGKYIDTLGPRKVTILGGILTGLGWLLASTVNSVQMLYLVYGAIGGIGVGIAYGVPIAVSARWFPDKKGLAVGLTVLGFGFSAFLIANLADYLITHYGIMNTFRIFGIAFIGLIILLALPLRFPAQGWKPSGWSPPVLKSGEEICECNRGMMLRTTAFYGLWVCFFIGCLSGLMAISIAKPVGTEIGIEAGLATLLVGFFAIFNGFGRPVFGSLTDRITPRNTALISFVFISLASIALWISPTIPVYILAFAILWACLGGWLAIAPTATGTYFGTCDYPRCYGIVFLAYGAGAIAGPLLAGFIKDSTGNYMGVFPYILALALLGFTLGWVFIKPPRRQKA